MTATFRIVPEPRFLTPRETTTPTYQVAGRRRASVSLRRPGSAHPQPRRGSAGLGAPWAALRLTLIQVRELGVKGRAPRGLPAELALLAGLRAS